MKRFPRLIPLLVLLLAAASAYLMACSDDSTPTDPGSEPPTGTVEGTVRLVPDDSLLVGVEMVLMDVSVMGVAAGPVATDDAGFFRFESVREGRFYPIPLLDQDLQFDRSTDALVVTEDDTTTLDLRVIRSQLWDAEGLKVAGVVQDAVTKQALAGAIVSTHFGDPSLYFEGVTLPTDDFTDAQGRFELLSVPVDLSQEITSDIIVTLPGYLPRRLRLPAPGPGEPDSLYVEVELEEGQGDAAIYGRVVLAEEPIAGVPVMLDWYDRLAVFKDLEKAPLLGFSTSTDAEGWYRFEHLSAGELYTVAPGYLPDDGFFFYIHGSPQAQFSLSAAERDTVEDLALGTMIEPIFPLPGSTVIDANPVFRWDAVAEADSYRVSFAVGHLFDDGTITLEPEFQLPSPLPDGLYVRWYVHALAANRTIGGFDQIHTFQMDLSADD